MGIARRATLLLFPFFVVLGGGMAFGQQSSGGADTVVLTALAAPSDDNEASALASTITQGLDLLLRLSGGATISRADFLSPNYDFSKSLDYYHLFKAKAGIFGSVAPDPSGGYTIKVDIWTSDSNSAKPTLYTRSISDILSVFDVADQLSLQVASRAVGQKLELGDLRVQFEGTLPHYSVYADGHLLGRDKSTFRILTGTRKIVVAKPGLVGDETIKAFTVDITTKKPTVIKVDVTPPKVAQATPKPAPPAPKPVQAPTPTTGRLVVEIAPISGTPSAIHLDINGPGGHAVLENTSIGTPFIAQLKPGTYTLRASFDQDPSPMVSSVKVELEKQTRVSESVGYSKGYAAKLISARKADAVSALSIAQRNRSKRARNAGILELLGLGGGGAAGYLAYKATGDLAAYQSATDPATATQYHTTFSYERIALVISGLAGGAFLLTGAGMFATLPSTRKFQQSVDGLDKQLAELNAASKTEDRSTKVKVLSVTPIKESAFGLNNIIRTVAGTGINGLAGDSGPATSAYLFKPYDVAVDNGGNLYIADYYNGVIRKVDGTTHIITTFAGDGTLGFMGDGGPAVRAYLNYPEAVAVDDNSGAVYIADTTNERIRRVDGHTGIITTYAGNGKKGFLGDNGSALSSELNTPAGLAVDSQGNLYIADQNNNRVRKVDAHTGIITTVAGGGKKGNLGDGGLATAAYIDGPKDVALDAKGDLFIADETGQRIRKVDTKGIISTIAGTGFPSYSGDGSKATSANINFPAGVAVDSAGDVYFSDFNNNRIRVITPDGLIETVAGTGTAGFSGDGTVPTQAQIDQPIGIGVDARGNIYFADSSNNRIREVEKIQ